jgi:glycosyltransferase involved in cell wall biosynthesis
MIYGMERIAGLCSNAELVQNPEDIVTLRRIGVPERKLTLLGNGIDLGRFDPSRITDTEARAARAELGAVSPDDVVVGLVGRLVREKGYAEVFAAASQLRNRLPNLRFAVIGDDDHAKEDALDAGDRARADAAGVRFLGGRSDVDRLYAAMDIYVLASHREGFPRSAMEAAAMGVPVIATDIRGCRQVVEPGTTGLLVPARDSSALAAAIESLAVDPILRTQLGIAGRAKALREFDERRCIAITLERYRALLARRAPAVPALPS